MKKGVESPLRILFGTLVAVVVIFCGVFAYYATTVIDTAPLPLQFSLKPGSGLRSAANQMERAGALRHTGLFVIMGRLLGEAGNIKPGIYDIDKPVTPFDLLRKITEGDITQHAITFVEGWTFRQMRKALDEHTGVRHDSRDLTDAEVLQRLRAKTASPEGLFFPNTYHFDAGSSD